MIDNKLVGQSDQPNFVSIDGRLKVPDNLIKRLSTLTLEEAYSVLVNSGYYHQFGDG